MQGKLRSVINILDLSVGELEHLMDLADRIEKQPEEYRDRCRYKKLATLFFEPSTRTRLSFEAAMLELGGQVLGFAGASSSSAAKGESVADTIAVVSNYADIITMRHPKEGAPVVAAQNSTVPFINAGDGGHFHPTQTLADILTVRRTCGKLEGLTLGLCGDLKFGRTVHSLIDAMLRYPKNRYILISPEELRLPEYEIEKLRSSGAEFEETTSLEDAIPKLDILYMTRVQKERFFNEEDYLRLKDIYVLTPEKLRNSKESLAILHPLPRVNEISVAVDRDPRAKYFYQTLCGKQMRMALILFLLGLDE
ncbi:aspartate carbamoyltransferase [Oribacterium sp. oral taxon 078 str. F0263]|uniref:aspartate carbamoyltransferase n=1 Tax=Oribacterium sp. oral taxon 078 TaxID=652706 RepID=UPI0003ADC787|nr:aspartate carbamoyltransferase [Oribacterium sp. oral taxon 078]ERL20545.1 aspartate carbamoyltransferase [Oribacterium sp. oral taxon 078 str. F0263]